MNLPGMSLARGAHSLSRQSSGTTNHCVPLYTTLHPNDSRIPQSDDERDRQINQLARQLTETSFAGGQAAKDTGNIFSYRENSDLDPLSTNFNAKKWTRLMLQASQKSAPTRKAGLAYSNLSVHGFGSDAVDYQKTVGNLPLAGLGALRDLVSNRKRKVQILNSMDGVLEAGEMLVVLGPPGSGCTTMLKTIAGEMNGIYLDDDSLLNYRGITPKQMRGQFRGEAIYTAEVDVHFPSLTAGQTLTFAAEARAPRNPPGGLSQKRYAEHMRDVVMSIFGIAHTLDTIVGNDFVRGVSGGERKRITISEAALAGAPLQCWDNSTRGLDSANAIEFCRSLRINSDYLDTCSVVAIYQAPQSAYDYFDKVCVLYEGQQIFFGKAKDAKPFFVDMGFYCPPQQTVPDFLTSLTSPSERQARPGFEQRVPRTPEEFAAAWRKSSNYSDLTKEIAAFNERYPYHGQHYQDFLTSRRAQQSQRVRSTSPYTLSFAGQVKICLRRGFQRLVADPSLTLTQLFGNFIMAVIISSLFYNLCNFYARGSLLFFAILLSAFSSALEILLLYAQRGIVEKHSRYAFYHPSAEAVASSLTDIPYKVTNCITFNLTLYFMTNLRREPGAFFFFMLISFTLTMTMSMLFRSTASLSRTLSQAIVPSAVLMLALIIYTGFVINVTNMRRWARWINWLDPIAYGFESLLINEYHNRTFACATLVPTGPGYQGVSNEQRVCASMGSVAGSSVVDGDRYLYTAYSYIHGHKWRNYAILLGFLVFFSLVHFASTEYITEKKSKGEVLVFPRRVLTARSKYPRHEQPSHTEPDARRSTLKGAGRGIIEKQTAIFSWKDVIYDIKIKGGESRRILDHVDGWVKPGTLTALMGVSGAGKTTLLDVLATRNTMGIVTGEILVDGHHRDVSFQRKTGYVQQQDLHLETSTVREALQFSAVLRQPGHVSTSEKHAYVEEVLRLLEMEDYADAVVGVPGTGLNVEQRKRLTIGVELVAKPALLLFLDEPTSGLDSQTSWNILQLLRKLANHGQAILCTIHQPSAMLFEQFDRLLLLAKGGKTVYYGEVGEGSRVVIDYFERNGPVRCLAGENPAEWMLSATGTPPGSHIDWHQVWLNSSERVAVHEELARIKSSSSTVRSKHSEEAEFAEFAAPFWRQFVQVLKRIAQQHWRTPSYIWSKAALCFITGLFCGFSFFKSGTSQQGLQNQLFALFMIFLIFEDLIRQIMPGFVTQRSLYEVRERPSKTYSWKVFILTNILMEIFWSLLMGAGLFFCWYYPTGFYVNAIPTHSVHLRGALMFLYVEMFLLFSSSFALMAVAGMDNAETAANIATLLFSLCLIFCGILVPKSSMPGFWKFMYYVSPFTYLVEGMLSAAVANTDIHCTSSELLHFNPPSNVSCGEYMSGYMLTAGGYLVDKAAKHDCQYCTMEKTNEFLGHFNIFYSNAWRNFGVLWIYVIFNVVAAIGIYWLARVPKNTGKEKASIPKDGASIESTENPKDERD
nr:ATP-binding cassette transporter [Cryptococcus depauperatus CBS 7855]